ncbi:hypothetical protein D9619_012697 [Psilocybe cf. subviscida]|uniref:lytic cellulose monooxygenase (C4-dehydrogenating) n=1 Tax=Psilocybe cf. subviscida TaxID=2480587 RepID=A0A8H5AR82_9AGAR|nr:hypothetical protein D9619_012697 [Psilocybe cf. subviscida]
MKSFSVLTSVLAAATYVSAHGHVHQITIAGKAYLGNVPQASPTPSVIRQISTPNPIKGARNVAINCGQDAVPAALVADAKPGDEITFDWTSGELTPWPHNIGPMLTYMASCGNVACDKYDPKDADWFKIDQVGRKPLNTNGDWVQKDLFGGGVANVTLPSNLAAGNYLIRHEIIALHIAQNPGGAEFYASCSQLRVGGNETGVPRPEDLVKLPGAYNDNDAGILVNVFNTVAPGVFPEYKFPGPAVAELVNGGVGAGSGNGTETDTPSNKTAPTDGDNTPYSGGCMTRRAAYEQQRPRVISRVMRRASFAAARL